MGLLIWLIAFVPLSLFRGFVLTVLWGWYVVPVFNAPTLSIIPAIGLSLTASYFTLRSPSKDEREADNPVYEAVFAVLYGLLMGLITLAIGWFWHLFI